MASLIRPFIDVVIEGVQLFNKPRQSAVQRTASITRGVTTPERQQTA